MSVERNAVTPAGYVNGAPAEISTGVNCGDVPRIEVSPALIQQVIQDILSAEAKADDAPASSMTHFDRALVLLRSLVPEWRPDDVEGGIRLAEAEAHMQLYLPVGLGLPHLVSSPSHGPSEAARPKLEEPIGPRVVVTRRSGCQGCPALKTADWTDHLENDETDSGTSAHCLKADRNITAYWYASSDTTPDWCPMLTGDATSNPQSAASGAVLP